MPERQEDAWTGALDDAARRAGVAQIYETYDLYDGMVTVEWIDVHGNPIRTEVRRHELPTVRDITPFDEPLHTYRTNTDWLDATHDIVERYTDYAIRSPHGGWVPIQTSGEWADVLMSGEWTGGEEQPEINEERGGALDEFLKEFKPQQITTERSDN